MPDDPILAAERAAYIRAAEFCELLASSAADAERKETRLMLARVFRKWVDQAGAPKRERADVA